MSQPTKGGPAPRPIRLTTNRSSAVADPDVVLTGRETIFRNGLPVGYLTSGGWGYTVARNIGLGYVRGNDGVTNDYLESARYELEVASERVPADLHIGPLFDPTMSRIKV